MVIVSLGPSLLLGGIFDVYPAFPAASIPDHRLHEPFVWRYTVLCDEPG